MFYLASLVLGTNTYVNREICLVIKKGGWEKGDLFKGGEVVAAAET